MHGWLSGSVVSLPCTTLIQTTKQRIKLARVPATSIFSTRQLPDQLHERRPHRHSLSLLPLHPRVVALFLPRDAHAERDVYTVSHKNEANLVLPVTSSNINKF